MHVFVHACVREHPCMLRPWAKNDIGALGDGIRLHEPLRRLGKIREVPSVLNGGGRCLWEKSWVLSADL